MRRTVLAAALAVFVLALPHFAHAGASLQAVEHPTNLRYIFAAFLAIWSGFFLYTMFLSWRERKLRRDVEELKILIQERAKKS